MLGPAVPVPGWGCNSPNQLCRSVDNTKMYWNGAHFRRNMPTREPHGHHDPLGRPSAGRGRINQNWPAIAVVHYSDDSENYTNVVHYRNNICSTTKTSSALLKMDINYQIYINNYSVCSALPKVVVHYLALLPSFQGKSPERSNTVAKAPVDGDSKDGPQ